MQLQQFMEEIKKQIEQELGKQVTVKINQVTKNNGVILDGVTIEKSGTHIYPNIYVNDLYEEYKVGRSIPSIIKQMMEAYHSGMVQEPFEIGFFKDYKEVKGNLVFKLINYDKNAEFLKTIPHIKFLDLAIVFYYLLKNKNFSNASILIHKEHMEMWNIEEEELYAVAKKNACRLLPGEIRNMEEIMREMLLENVREEFSEVINKTMESKVNVNFEDQQLENIVEQMMVSVRNNRKKIPMYVLSNSSKTHGAACILYHDILKEFANKQGRDLYILPSSVHEVIILPCMEREDPRKLSDMVQEVNRCEVSEEEILSDNVYYYSREKEKVVLYK